MRHEELVRTQPFTLFLLQLCKEHGINKDGILEDFATQVCPQLGFAQVHHSESALLQHREVTGKTCSSTKQTTSALSQEHFY